MFYERFCDLCRSKGVSVSAAAEAIGLSRRSPVDWRAGAVPRNSTLLKLAEYFDVSVNYLIGNGEKVPFGEGASDPWPTRDNSVISDDNLKFALFGGDKEITDAQLDEVKRFAQFIKERDRIDKQ